MSKYQQKKDTKLTKWDAVELESPDCVVWNHEIHHKSTFMNLMFMLIKTSWEVLSQQYHMSITD